ncbi:MAG: hypothetical protein QNJ11_08695 [Woeseiaceae bacterium]|nr:hypothetical protein [Woeseiaceae bacterium]
MRIVAFLLLVAAGPVLAQEQTTQAPDERIDELTLVENAMKRLDYLVGTWDAYDDRLDEDGNVVSTAHAVHVTEYFLGESVIQTTIIPEQGDVNKTLRFYDKNAERFYEVSVGTTHTPYFLSGGLDEYVVTFKGATRPDGVTPIGRFRHIDIEPNSFVAIMDVSYDGGESWSQPRYRQRMKRRVSSEPQRGR